MATAMEQNGELTVISLRGLLALRGLVRCVCIVLAGNRGSHLADESCMIA